MTFCLISNNISLRYPNVRTPTIAPSFPLHNIGVIGKEGFQVGQIGRQTGPPQDFKLPGVLPLLCSPLPFIPHPAVRVYAPASRT